MYIYRIFYISIHTGYFSREFQKKRKKKSQFAADGTLFFFFFFKSGEQEFGRPSKPRTWQLLGGMTATV